MVKLSGGGNKASVETKTHRKVSYDERTLIPEFQEEKFRLNPHVDGFTQQVNLVNRLNIHSEGVHRRPEKRFSILKRTPGMAYS